MKKIAWMTPTVLASFFSFKITFVDKWMGVVSWTLVLSVWAYSITGEAMTRRVRQRIPECMKGREGGSAEVV